MTKGIPLIRRVEVYIKGTQENRQDILRALLTSLTKEEIRQVIIDMPVEDIIKLSQILHGTTYYLLREHC